MTDRTKSILSFIGAWAFVGVLVLVGIFVHHPHWAMPFNPANPGN